MQVRQLVMVHFSRCLVTFLLEIISRQRQSTGHGSSLQRLQDLIQRDYILLYMRMTMKHGKSGIKKSVSRQSVSSVSEKKITSGSMVQVLVVHVQKFIMTVVKNMAVENQAVQQAANVTVIWKSGMMYFHSSTMTDMETILTWLRRTLIQVWDWSVLHVLCRMQILCLISIQ